MLALNDYDNQFHQHFDAKSPKNNFPQQDLLIITPKRLQLT